MRRNFDTDQSVHEVADLGHVCFTQTTNAKVFDDGGEVSEGPQSTVVAIGLAPGCLQICELISCRLSVLLTEPIITVHLRGRSGISGFPAARPASKMPVTIFATRCQIPTPLKDHWVLRVLVLLPRCRRLSN